MTKLLFVVIILIAIVALFARSPRARQALWTAFVLLGVYAVLKVTGVIEALAPARDGVF